MIKNCNDVIVPSNPNSSIVPDVSVVQNFYTVQLPIEFEKMEDFTPIFKLLRMVSENDIVRIDINSYGGRTDIERQLVECMKTTKATINGCLYQAWSAAAVVTLYCDNLIINDSSFMMIHNVSCGIGTQKINNNVECMDFYKKHFNELAKKDYKDFLTPQEIESVLTGTDIYLNSKEIEKRLKNRNSKQSKK